MNTLDIQYKVKLDKAKSRPNNIDSINRLSSEILQEAKKDGAERYRFWYNAIRKLHPLIDRYLDGQFDSSAISDVTGEHIVNLTADTQTVDLKYYYEEFKDGKGETKQNGILPLPIRSSIRSKIPLDQLKMTENAYLNLNKSYSIIMSTFFDDPSTNGDPNKWVITRNVAHEYYNTQDYLGFSVKLFLYDNQYKTFVGKYQDKLQLLDTVTPISERILIEHDNFVISVEGKQLAVDRMGNKIIKMPSTVDTSILEPRALTNQSRI